MRKIPLRMCVGCREMKPKPQLLRVVASPAGEVAFDKTGKAAGRGAYICKSAACFEKARKTRALARALEQPITEQVYDALANEVTRAAEDGLEG